MSEKEYNIEAVKTLEDLIDSIREKEITKSQLDKGIKAEKAEAMKLMGELGWDEHNGALIVCRELVKGNASAVHAAWPDLFTTVNFKFLPINEIQKELREWPDDGTMDIMVDALNIKPSVFLKA